MTKTTLLMLWALMPGLARATEGSVAGGGGISAWLTVPADEQAGACARLLTPGRESKVPLVDDATSDCPAARVGSEVVTLGDLEAVLAAAHEADSEKGPDAVKKGGDVKALLERLIQIRLIALEAREMGLDRDPATAEAIREDEEAALTQALERKAIADVRADAKEADASYRAAVQQYQVLSVLCQKKEEAQRISAAARGGKRLEDLAKEAVAAKRCKGGAVSEFLKGDDLGAAVAAAARTLKEGQVSRPVPVAKEYAVLRVERTRFVEDPKAKEDAFKANLSRRRHEALDAYYSALVKKYARVDGALLRRLDLEAKKPGFQALAKDQRTLAKVQGEPPITVGILATAIGKKFFHGMEGPIRDHQVNRLKEPVFRQMLYRRLFLKEARAQRLQETPRFAKDTADSTRQQLFGTFLDKVVRPSTKVTEAECKAWYDQHQADYTTPRMLRLEAIAFKTQAAAQAAMDKARKGTDFGWLRNNGDGQVSPGTEVLTLQGETVSARALPASLIAALAGSKSGDFRLHPGANQFNLVHVLADTPPQVEPYQDAREAIARTIYVQNAGKIVKDYADKLRKSVGVKVYLSRIGN